MVGKSMVRGGLALLLLGLGGCGLAAERSPEPAPVAETEGTPQLESAEAEDSEPGAGGQSGSGGGAVDAETVQALDCLAGTWTMTSFAVETDLGKATAGEGGEITFGFEPGHWWLNGHDSELTVSMGTQHHEVVLDGRAAGDVEVGPDGVRWSLQESEGEVEMMLPEGSARQSLPLQHFLGAVVPDGATGIECEDDHATIASRNTSVNQVLQLHR